MWAPFFVLALGGFFIETTPTRTMATPLEQITVETRTSGAPHYPSTSDPPESGADRPVPSSEIPGFLWVLILSVLALGLTAPFGTTALGMMSISDIRYSNGRVIGLPLAVIDALAYPLLFIDTLIVGLTVGLVVTAVFFAQKLGLAGLSVLAVAAIAFLIAVPICVAVDFLVARAVWRKAASSSKR
jgi:hypothetical protein